MTAPAAPPATTEPGQLTKETYRGRIHPDWCPGCGDFSVLASLQAAVFELGLQPHQVCVISGIGCSSNLPGYINTYGMHTLHGRALAVATGVALGNHELKVICTGGDGDGYGIGGNHFLHTMRRNVGVTYNKDNTYQWFNPRVKILEEQGHDPINFHKAIERGYQWGEEIPIGLFWRRTDLESLEDLEPVLHTGEGPLAFRNLGISTEQAKRVIQELL